MGKRAGRRLKSSTPPFRNIASDMRPLTRAVRLNARRGSLRKASCTPHPCKGQTRQAKLDVDVPLEPLTKLGCVDQHHRCCEFFLPCPWAALAQVCAGGARAKLCRAGRQRRQGPAQMPGSRVQGLQSRRWRAISPAGVDLAKGHPGKKSGVNILMPPNSSYKRAGRSEDLYGLDKTQRWQGLAGSALESSSRRRRMRRRRAATSLRRARRKTRWAGSKYKQVRTVPSSPCLGVHKQCGQDQL